MLQLPVLATVPASSRAIPSSQSARRTVDVPNSAASSSRRGAALSALMNPSATTVSAWPAPPPGSSSSRRIPTRGSMVTDLQPARGKPPLLLELESFIRRELHHLGQSAPPSHALVVARRHNADDDPFPPPPGGKTASGSSSTVDGPLLSTSRDLVVASSAAAAGVSGGGGGGREAFHYTAHAVLAAQQQPSTASNARVIAAAGVDPKAIGSSERLRVYREAFTLMSQHFGEYRDILDAIRAEYDAAVEIGETHRRHALELERELATARSYVQFIVDAETNELKRRAATAEKLVEERNKTVAQLTADLVAATQRFNTQQVVLDKLVVEEAEGHHRNKILSEGLRNESDRQAKVAENLRKVRAENTKLQTYCQLLEENSRDDQITIEELKEKVRVLEHHLASQSAALAVAKAPSAMPGGAGVTGRFIAVARAAMAQSTSGNPVESQNATAINPGVPRSLLSAETIDKQVDDLENRLVITTNKLKTQQRTINDLKSKLAEQEKKFAALIAKRGDRPSTPRPKWKTLRSVVPKFEPQDQSTSDAILEDLRRCLTEHGRRHQRDIEVRALSRAVLEWLGEENLCESDLSSFSASFVGLGNGEDVPEFLRFHGRVRNTRLRKGDVEQLLKSFWQARQVRRRAEASDVAPIGTFAGEWLRASTSSDTKAIELAYNMMDVCAGNLYDTDCLLFHSIMLGKLSEEVYHDSQQALEQLERMIRNSDKKHNTGFVSRLHLFKLIAKVYPGKPRENVLKLRFALVANSDAEGNVNYEELLSEDSNGNQTRFVEYLRQQHVEESQEALIDVEEAVRLQADENKKVTMLNARTAIRRLDSAMPESQIIKIVAVGFKIPDEQVEVSEQSTDCDVRDFIRRVKAGALVRRYSPKAPWTEVDDDSAASVQSPTTAVVVPDISVAPTDGGADEVMNWSVSTVEGEEHQPPATKPDAVAGEPMTRDG